MTTPEIAQVVMDANTVTTIANNINSLYSNAISQLTSYTLGIVALVGVLVPALVTLFQWRSLKAEKESLERQISQELTKAKSTIRDEIGAELKQLFTAEENNLLNRLEERFDALDKQLKCADASTFHIQGNQHINDKKFVDAAEDFCSATVGYMKGGDELNGQRTLGALVDTCLPQINKTQHEEQNMDKKIERVISALKELNQNSRYSDKISELISANKSAKMRVPKATTAITSK